MVRDACLCIHGDGGENLKLAGFFLLCLVLAADEQREQWSSAQSATRTAAHSPSATAPHRSRHKHEHEGVGWKAGGGEMTTAGASERSHKRAEPTDPSDGSLCCSVIVDCSITHWQLAE